MKKLLLFLFFIYAYLNISAQKSNPKKLASITILKDSAVIKALKISGAGTSAVINPSDKTLAYNRQATNSVNNPIVVTLSSKDSSNEFTELLVYSQPGKKTLALFNKPNPVYKSIGNHISTFLKNVEAGIDGVGSSAGSGVSNIISVVTSRFNIDLKKDGNWSDWFPAGEECDTEKNCPVISLVVKGIKYSTYVRLRFVPNPIIGSLLPGFQNVEFEEKYVFKSCGCNN